MELRIYLENLETAEGEWVDLPADLSEYDNHEITDSEGFEGFDFRIHRDSNMNHLNELAEAIEDIDDDEVLAVCETYPYHSPAIVDLAECFREQKYTAYQLDTLAQLAEEFVDEGIYGDISGQLRPYIDFDALGHDLGQEGYEESSYGYIIQFD